MNRLVLAILILFGVLIGLRVTNDPFLQLNFANQVNSVATETRSTGFNAPSTGVSSGAGVSQVDFNAPNQADIAADTTSLPPQSQTPIRAGW